MKINHIKFSFIFVFFFGTASSQVSDNSKWDNLTIYEHGFPLTTCESNFKNLFKNWSKWVKNHDEVEFLSYEYVETLDNDKILEKYVLILNNKKSLGREVKDSIREESNGIKKVYFRELYFSIIPLDSISVQLRNLEQTQKDVYLSEMEDYLNLMKNQFRDIVNLGDDVYKIKLKVNGKEYNHYVICRPQRKEIVYDNLFKEIREFRYRLD